LVAMETLADFGTVAVFNYDTLTTGIYKAWYGLFSLAAASQVASILILLALVVLLVEQQSRLGMRFTATQTTGSAPRIALTGSSRWLASGACAVVLGAAVVAPLTQLVIWVAEGGAAGLDIRYLDYLWHSVALGGLAAALVTITALLLNFSGRRHADTVSRIALKLSTIGYAVPGAVLAVGIFVTLAWVDRMIPSAARELFGIQPGAMLQGSVLAMLLAYLIRFLAVGYGPVESAMHRVTRNLEEAAIALGQGGARLLLRVHLPMLRGGLATAAILVFVDVMKEMPITLMTRPFGWDTLSVRIFELTSEGQWERAALPAVVLVLAGALPVYQLTRASE
ncbi:MAG: ABC transporter permease, partial [Rhodanobacter sp.]